jgi:purine-nucleoside phosphorylase
MEKKLLRYALISAMFSITYFTYQYPQQNAQQELSQEKECFKNYFRHVKEASDWLKVKTNNINVTLMIVLTGGVNGPEEMLTDKQEVMSSDIPYFPKAHAQGHEGKFTFGKLNGKGVVILKGRFHYYEGLLPQEVVFPYFVLHELGVQSLITINAVGGIRNDLNAGDIVMITDHINYMGQNPLRGLAIQRTHDQFTDMTNAYNAEYQELAKKVALEQKIELKQGVYLATMGPSYETKMEIKAFRQWGADLVGMSTLFEVITCNFLGIKVLAFSAVTNAAADRHLDAMNHEEVLVAMKTMEPRLSSLVSGCAQKIISL